MVQYVVGQNKLAAQLNYSVAQAFGTVYRSLGHFHYKENILYIENSLNLMDIKRKFKFTYA